METSAASSPETGFRLEDYDYTLPNELIARYPLPQRDQSRMMVLDRATESFSHEHFTGFPEYVAENDVVVVNNTRVLPARFIGNRRGYTGKVELLMLNPTAEDPACWHVLMKPARKLPPGTVIEFPGTTSTMTVAVNGERGEGILRIDVTDRPNLPQWMEEFGRMPIPPYLNRAAEEQDKETYQTVFSKVPGALAAPTAGLHFTPEILDRIRDRGAQVCEVTLAVSTGTFRTVEADDIRQHRMDPEYYTLDQAAVQTILDAKARGGKVIAVGTTVVKTLETVAAKFNGQLQPDCDWSRLFIYPGFQFQVVDRMLTNFHLPKSTLMMLISAFANRALVLSAYEAAVQERYRFFSYGDCMLIR